MPTFASSLVNHIRAALWLLDWPVNAEQVEAAGHPFSASVDKQLESSTFVSSTTKLVYGLASDNCAHASSSSLLSTSSTLSSLTALESPDTIQNVLSRDYEIDGRTGFVPSSAAVTSAPAELDTRDEDIDGKKKNRNRLPAAYDRWEDALASAPDQLALADADDDSMRARRFRVSGHEWRTQFHQMPVLDTTPLENDVQLLRRAHHVLAYLVHFYVHSSPPDPLSPHTILVPKALALPLVRVSKRLDIAPVLTFADTVLWNHEIIDTPETHRSTITDEQQRVNRTKFRPLTRANIRPLTLFTRGPDEANFYGCCAEIELRGVEALRAIAHFYDVAGRPKNASSSSHKDLLSNLADFADELDRRRREEGVDEVTLDEAAACLHTVASVIKDLTTILQSVREICDPHAFYFAVRPWFRGSDASAGVGGSDASSDDTVPVPPPGMRRWIYEGVDEDEVLELSGPSAGQSSIIHTLDIFLDVDHHSTADSRSSTPSTNAAVQKSACPAGYGKTDSTSSSPSEVVPVTRCPVSGARADDDERQQASVQCPVMSQRQREQDEAKRQLPNGEFMTRMRKYMPGSHQAFLEQLSVITHGPSNSDEHTSTPTPAPSYSVEVTKPMPTTLDSSLVQLIEQQQPLSIRELARAHPDRLLKPYNDAVLALKQFRDAHIRIACLYVVSMSRKSSGIPTPPSSMGAEHGIEMMKRAGECGIGAGSMGMAMCPAMRKAALAAKKKTEPVRGTGGNELSLLLKSCRDATSRTLL